MDNQLCAITEISDKNFHLTRTSVFTFIEKNKWFTGKLYLLFHPDLPVSQKSISSILTIYENTELVNCANKKSFYEATKKSNVSKKKTDAIIDSYKNVIPELNKEHVLYFSNNCLFLNSIYEQIKLDNFSQTSHICYSRFSSYFLDFLNNKTKNEKLSITFSSDFQDSIFSKNKTKIASTSCLIFDTFSNEVSNFSKVNRIWLHDNSRVINFLNNPASFKGILQRKAVTITNEIKESTYSSKFIRNNETSSKFAIVITTCNRPSCVVQLTRRLKELDPTCKIIVVDDASVENFDTQYIDCYAKLINNNGKKRWWDTVNKLWSFAHMFKSEYYIMLPDDSLPNENFFSKALDLWNSINDPKKIAMDLVNYDRIRNWTGFDRVDYTDELYLTQTTESSFLCIPEFIKYVIPPIPLNRWDKNPLLGSGVGDKLNNYWISKGRTIYGAKKSLISANKNCPTSVMNPIARKINPWIIK